MKPIFATLIVLALATPLPAITIETVPIGDPGNAADVAEDGCGTVNYEYRIGKYEVTVGQYTQFLNAVGATDAYGLYNPAMATDPHIAGIARTGVAGSYTYSVIGSANHPVTYVSWGDAARFVNWISNAQPTGGQDISTTETGSYELNGAVSYASLIAVSRNPAAVWFLPTEDEWYKAAFYQPAAQGGPADSYWLFPLRTNGIIYSDEAPGMTPNNTRVANLKITDSMANGYSDGFAVTGTNNVSSTQNYLTDVGAYTSSPSFYGTFDQAGNVWEWNESVVIRPDSFGVRGGSWDGGEIFALSEYRSQVRPTYEADNLGFRVAAAISSGVGDFNQNGTVDAADYVAWRKFDGGNSQGYAEWRAHFGQTIGSGSGSVGGATVPEPTSLVLVVAAATVAIG